MSVQVYTLEVSKDHAVPLAPLGASLLVLNQSGDTLYYADNPEVSAAGNQGSLTATQSATFTSPVWVISASRTDVQVTLTTPGATSGAGSGLPSGGTPGQSIIMNSNSVAVWAAPLEINVLAYGADPTGVADSTTALQTAINAAGVAGGLIYLPPGTYKTTATLSFAPGYTGKVTFRGAGRGATTIAPATPTVHVFNDTTASGQTLQHVSFEDFTVDCNALTGNTFVFKFHGQSVDGNYTDLRWHRVDTINLGNLVSGTGHRSVSIACTQTTLNSGTQRTITDIIFDDCYFGRSGGGGNTGIVIFGTWGSNSNANIIAQNPIIANVFMDRITFRDVIWNSGATPTVNGFSAGIQVGQDGYCGKVCATNCHMYNAADVGFEFDTVQELTVEGCTATDCWNSGYLYTPLGNSQDYINSSAVFHRCSAYRTAKLGSGASNSGFTIKNTWGVIPAGHLVLDSCRVATNSAALTTASGTSYGAAIGMFGAFRNLVVRNLYINYDKVAHVFGANNKVAQPDGLVIDAVGGSSNILIDGLHYSVEGTVDQGAFTGCALQHDPLSIDMATDATVEIANVTSHFNVTALNGVSTRTRTMELFRYSGNTDAFSANTIATDYLDDVGNIADLGVSAGKVTVSANVGNEHRLQWLWYSGQAWTGGVGVQRDMGVFVGSTPGTTITNHKTGVMLKRVNSTNYLECYADQATQTVRIDKIVAGVRTNLANTALVTAIAANTGYGIRGKIVGNVVTADKFNAVTVPATVTTAGDTTATFTLTGSDAATFGDYALGGLGFTWIPQDTGATLQNLHNDYMHVMRGTIRGARVMSATGAVIQSGIIVSANSGQMRAPAGELIRIKDCDFSTLNAGTGVTSDLNYSAAANKAYFWAQGISYAVQPAPATVTPGASVWTYTSANGYSEVLNFTGGTVTVIAVSTNGGTNYNTLATSSPAVIRLNPGDMMQVTYSVAPTVKSIPVL